jgi:hypothetical protein
MVGAQTGIELSTKYFFLNFLIVIFPLTITVDGQNIKGRWGTNFYPVPAGNHSLTVSWKLYWILPVCKGKMQVSLAEGEVAKLRYKSPWLFLLPGKLTPTPVAA